jgi:hypothetical protein
MNPHSPITHESNSLKSAKFGGCFRHPDPMVPEQAKFATKGAVWRLRGFRVGVTGSALKQWPDPQLHSQECLSFGAWGEAG